MTLEISRVHQAVHHHTKPSFRRAERHPSPNENRVERVKTHAFERRQHYQGHGSNDKHYSSASAGGRSDRVYQSDNRYPERGFKNTHSSTKRAQSSKSDVRLVFYNIGISKAVRNNHI